jgi:hypothetical protein
MEHLQKPTALVLNLALQAVYSLRFSVTYVSNITGIVSKKPNEALIVFIHTKFRKKCFDSNAKLT